MKFAMYKANPEEFITKVVRLINEQKLYAEKDRLYSSYNATKSEIKELDMIMKNVDMILGKEKEKDRRRDVQRKRSGELE